MNWMFKAIMWLCDWKQVWSEIAIATDRNPQPTDVKDVAWTIPRRGLEILDMLGKEICSILSDTVGFHLNWET